MRNEDFARFFKGKVMIVGIGNLLRGDDGIGPALIQRLQGNVRAVCLDAGTSPESFTGNIIKERPDTIVFVDAVHLGQKPGEYAMLSREDILKVGFTTHDISPAMLIQYLEIQIPSDIYLLGIQPETVAMGAEMSETVLSALKNMTLLIKEALDA